MPEQVSRRTFILGASTAGAALSAAPGSTADAATGSAAAVPATASDGVALHWLDGVPVTPTGAAFGVPWPKGTLHRDEKLAATTAAGDPLPVQSWPLASWPDGALKWTGHALGADAGLVESFTLAPGTPAEATHPVRVAAGRDAVTVTTGGLTVVLPTRGSTLITSVTRDGRLTAENARLVLHLQDAPDTGDGTTSPRRC